MAPTLSPSRNLSDIETAELVALRNHAEYSSRGCLYDNNRMAYYDEVIHQLDKELDKRLNDVFPKP